MLHFMRVRGLNINLRYLICKLNYRAALFYYPIGRNNNLTLFANSTKGLDLRESEVIILTLPYLQIKLVASF